MVVVETARGVTTRVRFLPLILTSLGSKSGTPFYLNRGKHVNTILGDSKPEIFSRYADRPEILNQALTALTVVCGALRALGGTNRCVQRTLVSKV